MKKVSLEITPPQNQITYIPVSQSLKTLVNQGALLELLVGNKHLEVGYVKQAEIVDRKTLPSEYQDKTKLQICL
ncbi:MAG: hypothetical protein MZU97_02515 [Bacillus subtilis]|nr:hypothetical protein [Bacillus subtilis]